MRHSRGNAGFQPDCFANREEEFGWQNQLRSGVR